MKYIFLLSLISFYACIQATILPTILRQAEPDDAIGVFTRASFFGLRCYQKIEHTATVNDEGVIPHSVMTIDGTKCEDDGVMTVLGSADDALPFAQTETIKGLIRSVKSSGEQVIYAVEKEGRTCGGKKLAKNTLVIIIVPSKRLNIGLVPFLPTARFMIVDDPTIQGSCYYKAPLRTTETEEPSTPTDEPETEPTKAPAGGTKGPGAVPVPGGPGSGGAGSGGAGSGGAGSGEGGAGAGGPTASPGPGEPGEGEGTPEPTGEDGTGAGGVDSDDDPEESPTDDDGSVCFPADATVECEDGSIKSMSDLEIGDRVRVSGNTYSDVFMFTHKDASTKHDFVRITTRSGESISATRGHYLYIDGRFAAASTAKVGSTLELGNGAIVIVSDVTIVKGTGLYNPQTVQGDIIVNGVRASTFTTTIEPATAQAMLAPLRMMFDLFGISSSVFDNGADQIASILPQGQLAL